MENQATSSLTEHLAELRKRLLYSVVTLLVIFAGCYFFAEDIYGFLVKPLADIYRNNPDKRLIYTGLTEAFFTYMKVAFYAALFLSFPIIAGQFYIFLAPGLYKKEKRVLLPFLIACPLLFVAGAALVYYFIFPLAWSFFLSFESAGHTGTLPIQLEARVSEYLSLVIQLMFAFGLAFQLPILVTLLAKAGLVSTQTLKKNRKYVLLLVFIFAAIVTPPDIISQIGLAIPMLLLYEVAIFLSNYISRK